MYLFENLNQLIKTYLSKDQIKYLQQAYRVARDAHEGQTRSSGEPYITHPVAVACILAEMKLDYETLMAALLHDVIEDTSTTYQDMEQLFGKSIAELVEGVSKLDKLKFRDKKEARAENFRKMIMAMIQDIRVIVIKLADRIHNMCTLSSLRPDKRRRIARETFEIYSPIAHRLGMHLIKNELEELGFEALYPNRYRIIKKVVKTACGNCKEVIKKILSEIEGCLQEAGIPCRVIGCKKYLYSIYCKMMLKEQRFHSITDVYIFRIIVRDSDACYRVLGQMHNLYRPRPGRVKDYIAVPKANGYQSLHTSMIGPHGMPVEVQIRTEDMDQMAEMGVIAFWMYRRHSKISTAAKIRVQRWMQSLLELQQSTGNSFEFIESVKSDFFLDEICVFTPEGRVVELPAGATPIDFAYAIHTDIGHACIGVKVDRKPYPLSQPLASGQTVEIITAPDANPSAAWLNFAVSSKARTKIRQLLKNLKQHNSINLDRIDRFYSLNYVLSDNHNLISIPQWNNAQLKLEYMKIVTFEDLLPKINSGSTMDIIFVKNLQKDKASSLLSSSQIHNYLLIKIKNRALIAFAKCCRPIPGDPIIAQINPDKGLIIHHELCRNIYVYQKRLKKMYDC